MADGGVRQTVDLLKLLELTTSSLLTMREKSADLSRYAREWMEQSHTPNARGFKQQATLMARDYLSQAENRLSQVDTLCDKVCNGLRDQRYHLPQDAARPDLIAAAIAQGRAFGDLFFAISAIGERYSAYFPLQLTPPNSQSDSASDSTSFEEILTCVIKKLRSRLSFYAGITISVEQEPPEPIALSAAVVPKKDRAFNAALRYMLLYSRPKSFSKPCLGHKNCDGAYVSAPSNLEQRLSHGRNRGQR